MAEDDGEAGEESFQLVDTTKAAAPKRFVNPAQPVSVDCSISGCVKSTLAVSSPRVVQPVLWDSIR